MVHIFIALVNISYSILVSGGADKGPWAQVGPGLPTPLVGAHTVLCEGGLHFSTCCCICHYVPSPFCCTLSLFMSLCPSLSVPFLSLTIPLFPSLSLSQCLSFCPCSCSCPVPFLVPVHLPLFLFLFLSPCSYFSVPVPVPRAVPYSLCRHKGI